MKKTVRILLLALALSLMLVILTGCEAFVYSMADNVNKARCELFGHTMVVEGYKPATCIEQGETGTKTCEVCGYHDDISLPIAIIEHDMMDATCEAPSTCSMCGLTEGEALGHTLADVEGLAPTCFEDGYTAYKVCECGHTEGKEELPAAHQWSEEDANGTKNCPACNLFIVKNNAGLASAIKNAGDGATIRLLAGEYGNISLTDPSNYKAKDLTLEGEDGVIISGLNFNNWNPVELSFKIEGLTIRNITFDTNGIGLGTTSMSDVVIEGCTFINDACILQGDKNEKLTNLTVKDCTFEGDKNGTKTAIMLENSENVTVTGCEFKNIDFNVLQANVICGTVLIDQNAIDGTGDRVFRFVTVNAEITISNNTIVSDGDDNGELAKATSACEITLEGNTWNGLSDSEVADKLINITAK